MTRLGSAIVKIIAQLTWRSRCLNRCGECLSCATAQGVLAIVCGVFRCGVLGCLIDVLAGYPLALIVMSVQIVIWNANLRYAANARFW
jgi:hypothetical protein